MERVDLRDLSPLDREVIQVLECFRSMESSILINQDHEDGDRVEEYLHMEKYFQPNFVCYCILMVYVTYKRDGQGPS